MTMKFGSLLIWRILLVMAIFALSANITVAQIEIVTNGLVSFWSLDRSSIVGGSSSSSKF